MVWPIAFLWQTRKILICRASITGNMCDMYYEPKQRARIRNPLPEEEPELEKVEEQPMVVKT